jgi:hypothetical protein
MPDSYFGFIFFVNPEIKHGSREKKNGEIGIENYYKYTLNFIYLFSSMEQLGK